MLGTSYMAPCVQDLRQVVVVCCERQSQSFIPSKKRQILGCFCMHGMHLTKNLTITIDNKLSIYSSDADVEVLACHHQTNTSAIIAIVSGTQNHSRIVNITSVCNQLGPGRENAPFPLWNEVKFIDHDPHWYTRSVKEAIHMRLHPNNINRDSGIEIPEAWILTSKKHNSRSPSMRTREGSISNSRGNNED